ncbi:hypothetical protein IW262DRAFT_1076733 [Armillaria fumosa]|nr:hypothetical protein IW262DRAFT_1076733 [Armillaria fumosa]
MSTGLSRYQTSTGATADGEARRRGDSGSWYMCRILMWQWCKDLGLCSTGFGDGLRWDEVPRDFEGNVDHNGSLTSLNAFASVDNFAGDGRRLPFWSELVFLKGRKARWWKTCYRRCFSVLDFNSCNDYGKNDERRDSKKRERTRRIRGM